MKKSPKTHSTIIIVTILSLILVLGCLQSGDTRRPLTPANAEIEYGYGLKITDFSPDYDEIYSRDTFGLNIEVQNVGEDKATALETELSRYGDLTLTATPPTGRAELNPPDSTNNIPGDSRIFTWQITAPFKTSTTEYDVSAKFRYDYASAGSRDYLILSRDRLLEKKGDTGVEVTSTSTTGPVEVKLAPTPDQVILDFGGNRSFPIRIDLADLGSGLALPDQEFTQCTRKIGCINSVTLSLQANPQIFYSIDCTRNFTANTAGGNNIEFGGQANLTNKGRSTTLNEDIIIDDGYYDLKFEGVQLIDDAAIISCFVETSVDIKNRPYFEQTYYAKAQANYRYQIEETAKVSVLGEGTLS